MENQEQKSPVEITIAAADAIKLDLEDGDTLAVVIKSDDVDEALVAHLKKNIGSFFPGVKILLFGVGANDSIDFAVIKKKAQEEINENKGCNTQNFCADCNCGKKEQYAK